MLRVVSHGFDINRHHHKGIYEWTVGKDRKSHKGELPEGAKASEQIEEERRRRQEERAHKSQAQAEMICTVREGDYEDAEDWAGTQMCGSTKYGPITISYEGHHSTLRPWDIESCPLAAAIRNCIIHFPIKPKSVVFALNCSLRTLSHISDTVGPKGRLIGVLSSDPLLGPKPEQIAPFMRRHPNTTVITEDIQSATLERYERLLSLPKDSRYAFLAALHPRLGANSPARLLGSDSRKLCTMIFSFLENGDLALVKSLIVFHGPDKSKSAADAGEHVQMDHDSQVEQAREVVLTHIDILHYWRKPLSTDLTDPLATQREKHTESEGSEQKTKMWVFLILSDSTQEGRLLYNHMKFLKNGMRTGLKAKEELSLAPWFKNHVLVLLTYTLHRDERKRTGGAKGTHSLASGSDTDVRERAERARMKAMQARESAERTKDRKKPAPPSTVAMPVPSFCGGSSSSSRAPPALTEAPHDAAAGPPAGSLIVPTWQHMQPATISIPGTSLGGGDAGAMMSQSQASAGLSSLAAALGQGQKRSIGPPPGLQDFSALGNFPAPPAQPAPGYNPVGLSAAMQEQEAQDMRDFFGTMSQLSQRGPGAYWPQQGYPPQGFAAEVPHSPGPPGLGPSPWPQQWNQGCGGGRAAGMGMGGCGKGNFSGKAGVGHMGAGGCGQMQKWQGGCGPPGCGQPGLGQGGMPPGMYGNMMEGGLSHDSMQDLLAQDMFPAMRL